MIADYLLLNILAILQSVDINHEQGKRIGPFLMRLATFFGQVGKERDSTDPLRHREVQNLNAPRHLKKFLKEDFIKILNYMAIFEEHRSKSPSPFQSSVIPKDLNTHMGKALTKRPSPRGTPTSIRANPPAASIEQPDSASKKFKFFKKNF